MKRVAWGLTGLPKHRDSTLLVQFNNSMQYFNFFRPTRGKYALEIGTERIKNLDRLPSPSELKRAWKIAADDDVAEQELGEIGRELEANEEYIQREQMAKLKAQLAASEAQIAAYKKEAPKVERMVALMEITADLIPSLTGKESASNDKKASIPGVFTNCEISQVLQSVSTIPDEDMFVAEMAQLNKQVKIHVAHIGDFEEGSKPVSLSFLQQQLQVIERVARSRGQRVNKLFYDPAKKEQAIDESDYTCIGPDEHTPCFFNTLFYVQAKQRKAAVGLEKTGKRAPLGSDYLLREGVARAITRIVAVKSLDSTLARVGLGVVCDDEHIVFVRVELDMDETGSCPVHVSKVLPITAKGRNKRQGLRYLARMMCCPSAEQFGLSTRSLLELLPPSYQYVRALGSGAFAEVVVVRDEALSELACKVARRGAHSHALLAYEARILGKLHTIPTGVPRLVHFVVGGEQEGDGKREDNGTDDGKLDDDAKRKSSLLLTSPVGTSLPEHMKSLRGESERHSFALRVFEKLKPVLSAVHAKGVIHGDIKPDNIIIVVGSGDDEDDEEERVILIDWGCAVEQHDERKRKQRPWWRNQVRTPFVSDGTFLGLEPIPEDDTLSLLLTCVAIRESPTAQAPWPGDALWEGLGGVQFFATRSEWLRDYALKHPELELTLFSGLN